MDVITKSSPTASDVHVNTPLTNISIAFIQSQTDFVASRIFPTLPVQKQSDRYYTYDRGEFNRDEADVRAPGTESKGGTYTVDNTPTYFCLVYAFHKDVDDQVRANEDAVLNSDRDATTFCTQKILIKREKTFRDKYFVTGVWTNEISGVASGAGTDEFVQWNDASSNPIADVHIGRITVKESTGFFPNVLVIGIWTEYYLQNHPDIIDRLKYGGQLSGNLAQVSNSMLAALFKVDEVVVMSAIENTANKGATNVHVFIGGDHALLVYRTPTAGILVPTAGYTFAWTGYMGANAEGGRTRVFRMESLASDRVEQEMAYDQKLISADLGYFFKDAVDSSTTGSTE